MNMTDYTEKKLLDHLLGKAAYTMPTTVYLALFTADPTDTGSLTNEVSATNSGYARQAVTASMSATNATTGVSSNSNVIGFGPATADWGTITHVGFMDAPTGGNMLLTGAMTSARTIQNGDAVQMAAQQLSVTFS